MGDGGKGSKQRPTQVPRKQFEDNWDKIFNNKERKDKDANTRTRDSSSR